MRPTFATRPASRKTTPLRPAPGRNGHAAGKGGYSVLEVLVVLAIMALAAALVVPRGALMIDRMTAHAVFFDLQRQMLELRRSAQDGQTPITVYDDPQAAQRDPDGRVLGLRAHWRYTLARPIRISEGGACQAGDIEIYNGGRRVMRLTPDVRDCRFIRLD